MTLPLWGQQEKSVDDPETIEEAINRIVAEHNADTEAHLADGESLESHKTETVIDHPAGSVLADKQTMTEIAVSTIFESLDGWNTSGDVSISDVPGLQLYTESGWQDESSIRSNPQVPKNFRDSNYDLLFQALIHVDYSGGGYDANFGLYGANSLTPEGFGFIINQGELFAYARDGASSETSSEIVVDLTDDHVYRAFLDSVEQKIYFNVDGVEVAVMDVPGSGWQDDTGPRVWVDRGTESDGSLRIGCLNFARGI